MPQVRRRFPIRPNLCAQPAAYSNRKWPLSCQPSAGNLRVGDVRIALGAGYDPSGKRPLYTWVTVPLKRTVRVAKLALSMVKWFAPSQLVSSSICWRVGRRTKAAYEFRGAEPLVVVRRTRLLQLSLQFGQFTPIAQRGFPSSQRDVRMIARDSDSPSRSQRVRKSQRRQQNCRCRNGSPSQQSLVIHEGWDPDLPSRNCQPASFLVGGHQRQAVRSPKVRRRDFLLPLARRRAQSHRGDHGKADEPAVPLVRFPGQRSDLGRACNFRRAFSC
jgi:hypothetical protein